LNIFKISIFNDAILYQPFEDKMMKTNKTINLLCSACTNLNTVIDVYKSVTSDVTGTAEEKSAYFRKITDENIHTFLSYPCDLVKDLYTALPEDLKTPEITEMTSKLYAHLHEDDYTKLRPLGSKMHTFAHDLYQEMTAARRKFGFVYAD